MAQIFARMAHFLELYNVKRDNHFDTNLAHKLRACTRARSARGIRMQLAVDHDICIRSRDPHVSTFINAIYI